MKKVCINFLDLNKAIDLLEKEKWLSRRRNVNLRTKDHVKRKTHQNCGFPPELDSLLQGVPFYYLLIRTNRCKVKEI